MNRVGAFNLSNSRFWRMHNLGVKVGRELANNSEEMDWVHKYEKIAERSDLDYDIELEDEFTSKELIFWSEIYFAVAQKCYKGDFDSENENEQVTNIWASYGIARLFSTAHKAKKQNPNEEVDKEIDYMQEAKSLMNHGELEKAIELFEKILELNPLSSKSYFLKGICEKRLGLLDEYQNSMNKSREIDENFEWIW